MVITEVDLQTLKDNYQLYGGYYQIIDGQTRRILASSEKSGDFDTEIDKLYSNPLVRIIYVRMGSNRQEALKANMFSLKTEAYEENDFFVQHSQPQPQQGGFSGWSFPTGKNEQSKFFEIASGLARIEAEKANLEASKRIVEAQLLAEKKLLEREKEMHTQLLQMQMDFQQKSMKMQMDYQVQLFQFRMKELDDREAQLDEREDEIEEKQNPVKNSLKAAFEGLADGVSRYLGIPSGSDEDSDEDEMKDQPKIRSSFKRSLSGGQQQQNQENTETN